MARKLLIVDDGAVNRQMLRMVLSGEYDVIEAADGSEALEIIARECESLSAVLLDIIMPVMNGFDVLTRMRADPRCAQIPVIVITGDADSDTEIKALSHGANDFVTKPFNPAIIMHRLKNVINLRESAATVNALRRDRLTGLYNREYFFAKAADMIAGRAEGEYVLCCLDIDNFKLINERGGNDAGDMVLTGLARALNSAMEKEGGIACRVSADNFSLLYPIDFLKSGRAEALFKEICAPREGLPSIVVSVGRYVVSDKSLTVSAMHDRAYMAKATVKGRFDSRVAVFDEIMLTSLKQRQAIVGEMESLLSGGCFEVWLQPQYNHATNALVGAEALVRLRHPVRGLVFPGEFIPVFEENGFIYELDKFMLERICALLRGWLDSGRTALPISVNISRYDVLRDDLISSIIGITEKYGVPRELIRLEITESAFTRAGDSVIDVAERLVNAGFTVEIDDFGSGYSSLNTLKDVPAQIVKLDMRFLENSRNNSRSGNIIESIVRMVKWLGMSVIAEGVENAEQANFLKSVGCNIVQGYLYAKPMTVSDFEKLADKSALDLGKAHIETVAHLDGGAFWDPYSMDTLIFNSFVGGACIFVWRDEKITMLRANDKYAETVFGSREYTVDDALNIDWDSQLSAEAKAAIWRAARTDEEVSCEGEYALVPGSGAKTYLYTTFRVIASMPGSWLIYATNINITSAKEAEKRISALNENLQAMMDDMPGGFERVRVAGGRYILEYVNDNFCRMLGGGKDEILAKFKGNPLLGVHPDDIANVRRAIFDTLETGDARGLKFRVARNDGGFVWIRMFGRLTAGDNGDKYLNLYYTDMPDDERRALSSREALPYLLKALMASTSDMAFAKDSDLRYICCSPAFARFAGRESDAEIIGKTDFELFDYEYANQFRIDDTHLLLTGRPMVDFIEPIPSKDGARHYASTSKYLLTDAAGEVIGVYGAGRDITESRTAFERLTLLTESIPGGLASYERVGAVYRLTYFNDGFCGILGYGRAEFQELCDTDIASFVCAEDLPMLKEHGRALLESDVPLDAACRVVTRQGDIKWVNIKGAVSERRGDAVYFNCILFDVTSAHRSEEESRLHEKELTMALGLMGRAIGELDLRRGTFTLPEAYARKYGLNSVTHDMPRFFETWDGIMDEGRVRVMEMLSAIYRGDAAGGTEMPAVSDSGERRWLHLEFVSLLDESGKPEKSLISIDDVTEAHERFERERTRPVPGQGRLISRAIVNLTAGSVEEYLNGEGKTADVKERICYPGITPLSDGFFVSSEERDRFYLMHEREYLLSAFARGETELSMDYRRRLPDGSAHWARNLMRLFESPAEREVLLYEYCYIIEEEKFRELMYAAIVDMNYDYVARVSGWDRSFSVITKSGKYHAMPPERGGDMNEWAKKLCETIVHPDDKEIMLKNTSVEGMKRNLKNAERFQFTCREMDEHGGITYKRFTETYLDRELDIIMLIREDITQLMQAESDKHAALSNALMAANQASQAKSTFLSRMSHELRTPMNAIIGLAALSAGDLDKPKIMEDNIAKIGLSARYLLSLINDILEMSRIESGRMTLNEEPFDFERFISEVNGIIYPQAETKGVDYDVIVNSYTEPTYVGDSTKLQEILINVLGNAVKFTGAGGKVTMTIEQMRRVNKRAMLRFIVTDTGAGIDEEYLPYLFEPFSQEATGYTSTATGTGLGLAITKNLVDMMGGQISVNSIKNVGSVFTVDVQLGLSKESQQNLDLLNKLSLEKLRALVVDDDITVCRSTESMLVSMGMQAEWVDSGMLAIELVVKARAEKRDFDIIFVDWKMPDMDGIETARRIRGIVGPDVTIIIMTAYDWQVIETEARQAGVSLFMDKPLFQSSIVKAFERVFMKNREKLEPVPPVIPDFSGRRILLAEDHPLNVEVARRLLQKVGAEVVVAGNGLEAIEIFTTAPDDHFSAILMDIRMPIMDGLTATKAIRNLRKRGSRDIPIIAMTANAFDDDVELSLSSGMNAHLAKPIEPQVLYATLGRLMKNG